MMKVLLDGARSLFVRERSGPWDRTRQAILAFFPETLSWMGLNPSWERSGPWDRIGQAILAFFPETLSRMGLDPSWERSGPWDRTRQAISALSRRICLSLDGLLGLGKQRLSRPVSVVVHGSLDGVEGSGPGY